jgi:hypothetical protein
VPARYGRKMNQRWWVGAPGRGVADPLGAGPVLGVPSTGDGSGVGSTLPEPVGSPGSGDGESLGCGSPVPGPVEPSGLGSALPPMPSPSPSPTPLGSTSVVPGRVAIAPAPAARCLAGTGPGRAAAPPPEPDAVAGTVPATGAGITSVSAQPGVSVVRTLGPGALGEASIPNGPGLSAVVV